MLATTTERAFLQLNLDSSGALHRCARSWTAQALYIGVHGHGQFRRFTQVCTVIPVWSDHQRLEGQRAPTRYQPHTFTCHLLASFACDLIS